MGINLHPALLGVGMTERQMRKKIMDIEKIYFERTKQGHPALWELGGGATNTGESQIICGPKGEKKKPVYVRGRGQLSCAEHGLFIVSPGDCLIKADHHREDFFIEIYCLDGIRKDDDGNEFFGTTLQAEYSQGQWDELEIVDWFHAAIEAAKDKAVCYHCRELHYALEE